MIKLCQMVLKGVNWVHNDKIGSNGLERSQMGTHNAKIMSYGLERVNCVYNGKIMSNGPVRGQFWYTIQTLG